MKYIDGSLVKIGDVFTDGSSGREDVRLKNRAKVLYVDKFTLVWFPLNDFTYRLHEDPYRGRHFADWPRTVFEKEKYGSKTWCLSAEPKKVEISELTEEELDIYNNTKDYLEHV